MNRSLAILLILALAPVLSCVWAAAPDSILTLKEAREIALRNHPRITVAELRALAAKSAVDEARSGLLPNLSANVGGVGAADNNTRIVAGGLTVSSVFDRASAGVSLSQLVTDFGRASNLTKSSRLHAQAEDQHVEATRAQIVLEVDGAYLEALQAQSVQHVTEQTVITRQLLRDQIRVLATNQLKSGLDLKVAEVSLQEARLLKSKAENSVDAAFARLTAVLGERKMETYKLVDVPLREAVKIDDSALIFAALRDRPDLRRLRLDRDSALTFAQAEKALSYPNISVLGNAGIAPVRDSAFNQNYAAAGVVLNLPLYSGGLYSSRQQQARLRAQAAAAIVAEEEIYVIRDVRVAALNARNARERLDLTIQLVDQAQDSYTLANERYKVGTSSIVELSQTQLSLVSAQIEHAAAQYEYLLRRSILDYQIGKSP